MRANEPISCLKADLVKRLRARLPDDAELEEARKVFALLADATRVKILHVLAGGDELCVCDVAHALRISISNASHHLRKLRDVGVLQHRTDGKWILYSLKSPFAARLVARTLAEVAA